METALRRYAFDPELAAALAMVPDVDISDVPAARAAQAGQLAPVAALPTPGVDVTERLVPGPQGAPDVRQVVYRPQGVAGPLPAVFSVHGGGFVVGTPYVDHESNARLCLRLGAVVVAAGYRLAPEHRHPDALEDCYAGLCRVVEDAGALGVAPDRIAVSGDSAGAALATGVAMLARDRGGPKIRFQHLSSPAVDDRLVTASSVEFTDTPVWNRRCAELSWAAYLGPGVPGSADVSPYAAPARADAAQLAGLPPAFVSVMEFDPLRDEGIAYARALRAAGVATELRLYEGTFHGAAMVRHAAVVRRASDDAVAALAEALTP
ncbi:Carboxylesterase NlhH [Streptomyces sp. RB5]|uniref:Carboxylesterase NlhH n=1 Tax=Streptomyces smaragdinus TaxID=2585196 RepID=A0A7K0CDL6_9ACTN|nr:alpha/beta hydrolase [Streptomyces smaragdinus]MQY11172.1 Carboxylesterase NlhH [Streptomyces smaragdinus]